MPDGHPINVNRIFTQFKILLKTSHHSRCPIQIWRNHNPDSRFQTPETETAMPMVMKRKMLRPLQQFVSVSIYRKTFRPNILGTNLRMKKKTILYSHKIKVQLCFLRENQNGRWSKDAHINSTRGAKQAKVETKEGRE